MLLPRCCIAHAFGAYPGLFLFGSQISIALPDAGAAASTAGSLGLSSTARNSASSDLRKRFFHSYNCHSRIPRSRHYTVPLCPLATCSETNPRHFDHRFVCSLFIPLHWASTIPGTRWG